jgi:excisionase family DNA binding protein
VTELAFTLPPELVEAIAQRAAAIVLERVTQVDGAGSPWLSMSEAAEYLRISERKLQRLVAADRIRSTTLGRRRLLRREDLDAFMRAATKEETVATAPLRRREE